MKTYSELITLPTFEERFAYLQLGSGVGVETLGSRRYLVQAFYHSDEWRHIRDDIIIRDLGRDMATEGYEIVGGIVIHHIVPITVDDILNRTKILFDYDNLVCVSSNTHKAIHYSDDSILQKKPIERFQNDQCPWKFNV